MRHPKKMSPEVMERIERARKTREKRKENFRYSIMDLTDEYLARSQARGKASGLSMRDIKEVIISDIKETFEDAEELEE